VLWDAKLHNKAQKSQHHPTEILHLYAQQLRFMATATTRYQSV